MSASDASLHGIDHKSKVHLNITEETKHGELSDFTWPYSIFMKLHKPQEV